MKNPSLKRVAQTGLAVTLFAGALAVTPAAAYAANNSKSCDVAFTSCTTGSIPAEQPGHWVNWDVQTGGCGADWKMVDAGNGVTVGSGHVGSSSARNGWIGGLYGSYYLKVYNTCWDANGIISNFD
jgi:hypothetical protein